MVDVTDLFDVPSRTTVPRCQGESLEEKTKADISYLSTWGRFFMENYFVVTQKSRVNKAFATVVLTLACYGNFIAKSTASCLIAIKWETIDFYHTAATGSHIIVGNPKLRSYWGEDFTQKK